MRTFNASAQRNQNAEPRAWRELQRAHPAAELRFRSIGVRRECTAGTVLYRAGDEADALFIVESGRCEVTATTLAGQTITLDIPGAGEAFGEWGLLNATSRRTATAAAVERSVVRMISREQFVHIRMTEPGFDQALLVILHERFALLESTLTEIGLGTSESRIAGRLLRLCSAAPPTADGEIRIALTTGTTRPGGEPQQGNREPCSPGFRGRRVGTTGTKTHRGDRPRWARQ